MRALVLTTLLMAGAGLARQPPWTLVTAQPATIGVDSDSATAFAELVRGELAPRPGRG